MKKKFLKPLALMLSACLIMGVIGASVFALNDTSDKSADTSSAAQSDSEKTDEKGLVKDETVYVLAGADGGVKKIIVSDWIKNTIGADKITDKSDLKDPENVKGDETYTMNGDNMKVWDAEGNDIYCNGTIEKELPVNIAVSYKLDGQSISAESLAGKSGKVTIRFDYQNNQYETVSIDGKNEKIYVPFAMLTGLLLDNDVFTNVDVTNGKLINDGDRIAVAGIAFPGLQENLNVSADKFEIPSYIEITADVKDFEMGNTITLATNEIFNKIDLSNVGSADELTASLNQLGSAMQQLLDGSSKLYGGLCTLLDKSGELVSGINKLADGAKQIKDGTATLDGGAGSLASGSKELLDGLTKLSNNNDKLNAGAKQVFDTLLATVSQTLKENGITTDEALTVENYKTVLEGLIKNPTDAEKTQLITVARASVEDKLAALNVPQQYYPAVEFMLYEKLAAGKTQDAAMAEITVTLTHATMYASDPVKYASFAADAKALSDAAATAATAQGQAAINGLLLKLATETVKPQIETAVKQLDSYNEFYSGLGEYTEGVDAAKEGANKLTGGANQLKAGTSALTDATKQLYDGILTMQNGAPALTSGITELRNGSMKLSDGLKEFNEKGVSKLLDAVNGDLKGLYTRVKATADVSKDYKSFSGLSDEMDGQVKFIYRTDAIEK